MHHSYPSEFPEVLVTSLSHTQHLIIALDHQATQEIRLYYESLMKQYSELAHIDIQFIFPQFHLVESMLEDYIEEEALFAQEHIMGFFSDHLQ